MKTAVLAIITVLLAVPALAMDNIGGYYRSSEPYWGYANQGHEYGYRNYDYGYGNYGYNRYAYAGRYADHYPNNGVTICNSGCYQPNVRTTVYWQPDCPQPWASNIRPTRRTSIFNW